MSEEMIDIFNAMKEIRLEKRRNNKDQSTRQLVASGLSFESKNNGVHLIVRSRWDFWPSTGLYVDRKTGKRRRGVRNLLRDAG